MQYDNLTKGILFKHKVGPFDIFSLPSLLLGLKIVNCLQKSLQRVVRKLQTGLQGNKAEGQPMFGKKSKHLQAPLTDNLKARDASASKYIS